MRLREVSSRKLKRNLFSIITVTFNAEDYLEKTILSVLDQTYKDIEYINTLIECEYISEGKELYMYDILFSKHIIYCRLKLYNLPGQP